jgi:hypothetical protein
MTEMRWYNPTTGKMENADHWPANDEQAIDMLSHHPDSDEFIEEYRRWRHTYGIVESLILTGEVVQAATGGEQPPS